MNIATVMHKGFKFAAMLNYQRIFVTGATGFVGAHTLYFLLQNGYEVVGLMRNNSALTLPKLLFKTLNDRYQQNIDFEKISWVLGDTLDPLSLIEASKNCDAVVHTAASVSFQAKERDYILKNNIEGTENVVTACIENGIGRLIHLSSVAALPNPDKKRKLDETFLNSTFFEFETSYGESKYRSEMEVWRASGEGVAVTVLNPGIILGEWKFTNSSVQMFKSVNNGLPFYTSGLSGLVDVINVAEAIINSLANDKSIGQRFILVGQNLWYKDFLNQIADALGKKRPSIKAGKTLSSLVAILAETWATISGKKAFITRELTQSANRQTEFDNTKAREVLGVEFTDLKETIARTAQFLQAHPELQ